MSKSKTLSGIRRRGKLPGIGSRRRRSWVLTEGLLLLTVGAGVGALSAANAALGPDKNGVAGNIQLQVGPGTPPVPFVTESAVVGLPGGRQVQLHARASGALTGWTSPVGVSSPDGQYIVYDAWTDEITLDPERSFSQQGILQGQALGRPSLHLLDTLTGSDTLFEDGAYSFAWRTDGAVAYFKAQDPDFRANQPYVGQVMVQTSLQADPVAWTSQSGRYIVIAWAGQTLLAYRVGEGEVLDLVSLSGPGKEQLLHRAVYSSQLVPTGRGFLCRKEREVLAQRGSLKSLVAGKLRVWTYLRRLIPPRVNRFATCRMEDHGWGTT